MSSQLVGPGGGAGDDLQIPFYKRLHWQVFLTHVVVITVVLGAVGAYVGTVLRRNVDRLVTEEFLETADVAIAGLQVVYEDPARRQDWFIRMSEQDGLRATLIDADGIVIADSAVLDAVDTMENHGDRPEVVAARETGEGLDKRVSATLGIEFLYYARRIDLGGQPVFFRIARPYELVSTRVSGARTALLLALAIALLTGIVLSFIVARRTTRPIEYLSRAARVMGAGNFREPMPPEPSGELATLYRALEQLRRALVEKISELEDERALLFTILGAMAEGVIVVDATTRVFTVNPVALDLLSVSELWGSSDVRDKLLIEVTRNPRLIELVEAAIQTGEQQFDEIEIRRRQRRVVSLSVAPLREDDAVRGAVAALHDVTQVRQLERVRQDFVANVSHELRTPIAAIRGWSETLTSGIVEMPEFVEEQLVTIHRHSERLAALVDDLLALARVEARGIEEDFEPLDLDAMISDILGPLEDTVREKQLSVDVHLDPDTRRVLGEPRAYLYIMRNLIENAVKYTLEGGDVSITVSRGEAGTLDLVVGDTGIGIEEHHLTRIFERFYRVDKGRSRDLGGTGLGLSIVKHFVTALGGEISVESRVGSGSTFRVTIPDTAWSVAERDSEAAHDEVERERTLSGH